MTSSEICPGFRSTDVFLACNAAEGKIQIVAGAPAAAGTPETRPHQARSGRRIAPFFSSERAALGQGLSYMASDIAHALQGAGCPVSGAAERLRGIACVRGPGAFTGLRLALSTVLGLHKAWGTPLAGLDYLPLLVRGAGAAPGENVWVLTHSRNRQVYVQGFHSTQEANAAYVPLGPPDALDIETVTELVCAAPGPCRVLGSGLRKNFAFFSQSLSGNPQLTLLPESFDTPSATLLLQVAAEAHYTAAPIPPLYLRASDAEDNLCEIAQKHGYDPEVAAQLLAKKTSD